MRILWLKSDVDPFSSGDKYAEYPTYQFCLKAMQRVFISWYALPCFTDFFTAPNMPGLPLLFGLRDREKPEHFMKRRFS